MDFKSRFDKLYFLKKNTKGVKDSKLVNSLLSDTSLSVDDKVCFLLSDSLESYGGELYMHSRHKTFYKDLCVDTLSIEHIPCLFSCLTHIAIGYRGRYDLRYDADVESFNSVRKKIDLLVSTIIKEGSVSNTLYKDGRIQFI
jgi:hypothetical protein